MNCIDSTDNCNECGRIIVVSELNKLTCSICINDYHVQCTNLSRFDHKGMSKINRDNWTCHKCICLFPFNHIIDENVFVKLTKNIWKRNIPFNCEDLLFDPFEHLKLNDVKLPCDQYDPDIQHYSGSQNIDEVCNSNYYDNEEFNNMISDNSSRKLSFYHCNVRSARHNSTNLSNYMMCLKHRFDIIGLSETWLNPIITDIGGFPDYVQVHKYREKKSGGGVSLLINNQIKFHELDSLCMCNEVAETVFVEIEMSEKNIIVGCIYRPPGKNVSNMKDFNDTMTKLLNTLSKSKKEIYLMGDFNIDLLHYKSHKLTAEFVDLMLSSSFFPLINRPTRVTEESATIIDNIFTNSPALDSHKSGILPTDVSDHFSIFTIICGHNNISIDNIPIITRQINNGNLSQMKNELQNMNWIHVLDCKDTEMAYSTFSNTFQEVYDKNIPVKIIKHSKRFLKKPWITEALIKSIDEKNRLYKVIRVCGNNTDEDKYKKYKNKLTSLLKIAERKYYRERLDKNKNNLSKLWNVLNEVINRKKQDKRNVTFKHNNATYTDSRSIADQFNNFFLNAPKEICRKFPPPTNNPSCHVVHNKRSIFLNPVTETEVSYILSHLKNSSAGNDHFEPKVVKHVSKYLVIPLVYICNLSFSEGIFPSPLKIAKVVPIYKKGDRTSFTNYRPVSVLPVFSKLLERLMYNRLENFIEHYDILNQNQFGFRKGHSTYMAMSILVDKFHETINDNKFMVCLFLDLSRAFDTISHDILLDKLHAYGIRGTAHEWLSNYLNNRRQFVSYNGMNSYNGNIDIGVPQGSILGPLLFLLYVNDLYNVTNKVSFIQFADDTSIYATGSSLADVISIIQSEVCLISEWLRNNKLLLNASKSSYMIMTNRKKYAGNDNIMPIKIDGTSVECVPETKFLGIVLDNRLTFKSHINTVASKLSKGIGILCRAKRLLDSKTLTLLYNALIQPYLAYCITIWGHTYQTYISRIHLLQKKLVRIISNSDFRAPTINLFKSLKIMTIYQLYEYFTAIFVYKTLHSKVPAQFWHYFKRNVISRHYYDLRPGFHTSKVSEFSVKVMGPRIWNRLSIDVKKLNSVNYFKYKLKKCII